MDTFTPPTPARRRAAIERLRSVTSTVALAGGMATIGFAALAAATFRGTASTNVATRTVPDEGIVEPQELNEDDSLFDSGTTPQFDLPQRSSQSGGPTRAAGPGHATTGGS